VVLKSFRKLLGYPGLEAEDRPAVLDGPLARGVKRIKDAPAVEEI
jgi:hypothetical protein